MTIKMTAAPPILAGRRKPNCTAASSSAATRQAKASAGKNDGTKANRINTAISSNNKIRLLFFFFRFSTGSLIPFMSLYMQHVGLDTNQIGTLQAIRPIVTMLSAPLWGGLADRTGRKKLVLITTFVLSCLCRLSARFMAGNIMTFACSLCVSSIFYSPVASLLDSIVVSSLSDHDKANYGKLRLWGELGNGVASTIMMNIIIHDKGFEYMFVVHLASSVVALIFMLYCVPTSSYNCSAVMKENNPSQTAQHVDWKEGLRVIFSDIQILSVFGLVAITGYSMAILENFCYINIRTLYSKYETMDAAGRDISLYRVFFSIGGTLTWWFSGSLSTRFGSGAVMFTSVCCLPICFFLYAGLGTELDGLTKLGFLVAEAIRSGIFAALYGTATIQVNRLSPGRAHSVMQTMLEATYRGIGHTSGSYFGGMICQSLDISNAFLVVGKGLVSFLCMLGAVGFWMPWVPKKNDAAR